jgi:FSR family fosmidomycin resistance protein-like MFS transporter
MVRLAFLLLIVEFLDELVFGVREAAWPLVRDDLRLTYDQIGLLLSLPGLLASLFEPVFGVWADQGRKWAVILGGGLVFAAACWVTGWAPDFRWLMFAFCLFAPASGAFVSIGQAALMDTNPRRHEQLMVRWALAGSLGLTLGPWLLAGALSLGSGWRALFVGLAGLAVVLVVALWRLRGPSVPAVVVDAEGPASSGGWRGVGRAFKRREVWRWLILLQASDFVLDVLLGFVALYIVDVAGGTPVQGALAAAVFTGVGLVGDILIIHLLERVPGLRYLRISAAVMLPVYLAFLLVPDLTVKLVCLGLIGLLNAGWYAILKARFYSAFPSQSGTAVAVDSLFGLLGGLVPLALGLFAAWAGLGAAMWLLALGPVVVGLGITKRAGEGGRHHSGV